MFPASHSRRRMLRKVFFLLQVCSDSGSHTGERDRSVSVQGSKNCLETIYENVEHSPCFLTVGGA